MQRRELLTSAALLTLGTPLMANQSTTTPSGDTTDVLANTGADPVGPLLVGMTALLLGLAILIRIRRPSSG